MLDLNHYNKTKTFFIGDGKVDALNSEFNEINLTPKISIKKFHKVLYSHQSGENTPNDKKKGQNSEAIRSGNGKFNQFINKRLKNLKNCCKL